MNYHGVIARRLWRPFDMAMDKIWISTDSCNDHKYVLFHFMNHSNKFGCNYINCENMTQLNDVKSKIINNKLKIDWNVFNIAKDYLNDN